VLGGVDGGVDGGVLGEPEGINAIAEIFALSKIPF
jgi:hypothetical protein